MDPFADADGFEWDRQKAEINLAKHSIDFDEASEVFYGETVLVVSDRDGERRWLVIGEAGGRVLAVVVTLRGSKIRIISARRARKNEERTYRDQKSR